MSSSFTLFIGNVDTKVKHRDLKNKLSPFCLNPIESIRILKNYAFIDVQCLNDQRNLITLSDKICLYKKKLRIEKCKNNLIHKNLSKSAPLIPTKIKDKKLNNNKRPLVIYYSPYKQSQIKEEFSYFHVQPKDFLFSNKN